MGIPQIVIMLGLSWVIRTFSTCGGVLLFSVSNTESRPVHLTCRAAAQCNHPTICNPYKNSFRCCLMYVQGLFSVTLRNVCRTCQQVSGHRSSHGYAIDPLFPVQDMAAPCKLNHLHHQWSACTQFCPNLTFFFPHAQHLFL